MKLDWRSMWQKLSSRERWMLVGVGVICFLVLFYEGVYGPLMQKLNHQKQQLLIHQQSLAWLQQVHYLAKSPKNIQKIPPNDVLTVLAKQLNASSFKPFPYQLDQTEQGDVQLSFENIAYGLCMEWLWALTQHYVLNIKQLDMQQTKTPGVINVRMVLHFS